MEELRREYDTHREGGDHDALIDWLQSLASGELSLLIADLPEAERTSLLTELPAPAVADLVERLPDSQAVDLMEDLPPANAAAIFHEMVSDEQADLIAELDTEEAEAILEALPAEAADEARALSAYAPDSAGGIMITEILQYPDTILVGDVLEDLQENAEEYREWDVQYAYVSGAGGDLVGVLPMRDLLFARRSRPVHELMIPHPEFVHTDTALDELRSAFERRPLLGLPVVDPTGRLVGVVRRRSVEAAAGRRAESELLKARGLVHEELRTMPLLQRSGRRLAWLSLNILLNVLAASVIAYHEDTLQAVIAVAVFLPVISDMSGCAGNQAVAVSLRELTLGVVRPRDVLRVWSKELSVGLLNGLALGVLIGLVAFAWKGSGFLGLVVGSALAVNTVVASVAGGTIPLFLRRLGQDPGLASGPILTTVTDLCGFLAALSLAKALLPYLTG